MLIYNVVHFKIKGGKIMVSNAEKIEIGRRLARAECSECEWADNTYVSYRAIKSNGGLSDPTELDKLIMQTNAASLLQRFHNQTKKCRKQVEVKVHWE
ncbi:MAG: hypothetical protein ABH830_05255 [Patescibacteria group bacterium]